MLLTSTGPHVLRILLTWLIFYYVLNLIYQPDHLSLQKRSLTLIGLYLISVILDFLLHGYSYIFILILIYFSFSSNQRINYYLINTSLLGFLVKFLSVIIPTRVLVYLFPIQDVKDYSFILTIVFFQFLFSFAFIYIYKFFQLDRQFKYQNTPMTSVLLGYLYIVLYSTMLFARQFRYYLNLVTGILVFVLLQCILIVFIFIRERRRQKRIYQDHFAQEQVQNLKIYTDQLERDQLKLRHFKHDYKNLLFSLKSVAEQEDYSAMNQALDKLENYSDEYLNNLSMDLYKDLNNVKNPYLKSLFISKLNTLSKYNITGHFHCRKVLSEVPINTFDLINLLDKAIDNAINFTKGQEHGEIQLAVTQEHQQVAFLINNSRAVLPTIDLEEDHLDDLHIKNLKKKYSNIFIQYNHSDKWFRFHVTLINKGVSKK